MQPNQDAKQMVPNLQELSMNDSFYSVKAFEIETSKKIPSIQISKLSPYQVKCNNL